MKDENHLFKSVKQNIDETLEEIARASQSAGRNEAEIRLMAVTKTKPLEYAEAAYTAGLRLFGENRVAELTEKFNLFHDDAEIHLIGHLQRNKAKKAVQRADSVDSIDKYETALELDKFCKTFNRTIDILLEFNTSSEDSKNGFLTEEEMFSAIDKIRELSSIRIKGLMTIAPFTDDEKRIRTAFRQLKKLYDKLSLSHPDLTFDTLSMGMSSDFKVAIEEGSNVIRIGTRLFGSRY
ncbi:MAG: YggS family pyridoxal phosphate-dependent enzyme [Spirochaetia bacterium]|nr:YggS family pyridoxal phosphate-dependent enzyme [Spirochaetia bacterium]